MEWTPPSDAGEPHTVTRAPTSVLSRLTISPSALLMIIPLITTNRRARTTMGSALERHAAGRDLPSVREKARELAAASVSANTRRAYASMCVL